MGARMPLLQKRPRRLAEVRPAALPGQVLKVPAYKLEDETIIWGATAMMLSELERYITGGGR